MDDLLKNKPAQLADERIELFALIDRFHASIMGYHNQYNAIVGNANSDIRQRNAEKSSKLHALRDSQDKEKRAAEKKHSATLELINRNINNIKNDIAKKIEELELMLQESIKNEKANLNGSKNVDENIIKSYRDICEKIDKIVNNVNILLGNTLSGKSKFEQIKKEIKLESITVSERSVAISCVSKDVEQDAQRLIGKIREITESLPKKIVFNKKRTEAIKDLLQLQLNAKVALHWLENSIKDLQAKKTIDSDKRCQRLREECNQNKQNLIDKREAELQRLRKEIEKENNGYNAYISKLVTAHQQKEKEQANYFDTQISGATINWKNELEKCSNSFISYMEEQYPSARMNAWINQFWYHPRNVEDYSRIPEEVYLNVLIGMAKVDISNWVNGEQGRYVSKVLTNYIALFGRNVEQANKSFKEHKIVLPYTISIERGTSLLLLHDDASDERAKMMINAISIRMLRSVPACMMRFLLFDAAGMGTFGSLKALDPANIINPTEPTVKSFVIAEGRKHSDMAQQLSETEISLSDIESQLNNYNSIREFNNNNPLSKQIYRPLLMTNYPYGFEEEELRTLNKLISDCSKLGFSFLGVQPDRALANVKVETKPILNEIEQRVINLRVENNRSSLKVVNSNSITEKNVDLFLYGLPTQDKVKDIISDIRQKSVAASKILIKFVDANEIMPDRVDWYKEKGEGGIIVPVGYLEGGQPFKIQFDDMHINTVIMGNIRSGKSNLLHILMMNTMLRYAPEEVRIHLIDFKYGLDFRIYTQYNLPNFKTIGINSDPEFALDIIKNLVKEQQDRAIRMGSKYHKISEYNADHPNEKINRIILIIDELYVLSERAEDEIKKDILQTLNVLVHQNGAFGIHLVLCGQDLDKIDNFETISHQCSTRIALKCGDEQVKMLMDEAGVARMHSIDLTDQGAGVFSITGGANPQIEHTAYISAEEQDRLLAEIHKHYIDNNVITDVKIMLTKIADNPNHPLQMFISNGILPDNNGELMIGAPISAERTVNLHPQGNLWIAGGNVSEESSNAGESILFFAAYSLLLEKLRSSKISILCTNCADQPTRNVEDEEKDLIGQLSSSYKELFTYSRSEECVKTLASLMDEMDCRKVDINRCGNAVWWFLVKPEIIPDLFDNSNFVIEFKDLLLNGPKYNIHIILWNYDIKMAQKMQIDKMLFSNRVCLEMNSEDVKFVNGSELKPGPKGYKAILIGNRSMRIRVYDIPDGMWMNQLFARIDSIISK